MAFLFLALAQIQSRKPFSYDPEKDPTYQQYKAQYERGAQQAMQDTMGQVMTRTGGLASSFAQTAGQQSYNAAMAQLADKMPELRQLAYQMYMNEGDRLRSDLQMYDSLDSSDASRWQATVLNPFQVDRAYAKDVEDTLYSREQDALAAQRYEREWAYKEKQDQEARDKALAELLASGGNYSGYQGLYGLSPEDAAALGALWKEGYDYDKKGADLDLLSKQLGIDLTRKQIDNYGKGSGGSSASKPKLTYNQTMQAIKDGNITPAVKAAYEYYMEEPYKEDTGNPSDTNTPMPPAIYTGLTQRVKAMLTQGNRSGAVMLVNANTGKMSEDQADELMRLLGLA